MGSQPTYAEVVSAIFGSIDPRSIHVTEFKGDPHNKDEARWNGQRLSGRMLRDGRTQAPSGDANSFICMGVLDPDIPGRSLANVIGHVAFWMDDVGTKVPMDKVEDWCRTTGLYPTAIFNTSPGNFSYVWTLKDMVPADGGFDDQTVAAVRAKLKADGWGDPAAQDAARYMRSGFGVNGKAAYRSQVDGSPFEVKVVSLDAWRVSLADFAAAMIGPGWRDEVNSGAYLKSAQIARQGGGSNERNASMDDPLVRLAALAGLDPQPSTRAGVIDAHCPNEAAHTHGDPTGYAFINRGMSFCNHASCGHLNSLDFEAMIVERYDQMIADGLKDGSIIEDFFEDVLLDTTTRDKLSPDGRTFLAAASFEGVGADENSVKQEAEAVAERARAKDLDADQKRAALFDRFVYVDEAETFWDRESVSLISATRLDKDRDVVEVFGYSSGDKRGSVKMLNDIKNLIRTKTTTIKPFRPDQPPSTDIVTIIGKNGLPKSAINEFVPTSLGVKQGSVTPWLDHLKWMYGDQPPVLEYLLDMLAFFVQHPGVKSSVIPILVGGSGVGKDLTIIDVLIALLGKHNVANITALELANNFNEFLKKPLIHMGEFSMAGRDSLRIYDKLKSLTSGGEVMATINPKYGKQYEMEVAPRFVGSTNNVTAMESMTDEDRRFFIARSNAEAKKGTSYGSGLGTDPYFRKLTAWLKTPGSLEAIHHYLLNRQITVFDPNTAPPRTASRHDVVVASLNPVAQFAYDLVTEGDLAGRKVFSFAEVHARAVASSDPSVRNKVTPKQLAEGLRAAGCWWLGRHMPDRHTTGSKKRERLWSGACVTLNGAVTEGAFATEAERDALRADIGVAIDQYIAERKAIADALAGVN
jgi:hypothetical protein